MRKKIVYSTFYIAALWAAMSFIAPAHSSLTVTFNNYVGSSVLKLDSATYKNELGQPYTVSKFKYYIGNIHLTKSDGTEYVSNKYYLVNEEDDASKQITLTNIPEGNYTAIHFTLGVDSLHNCSGAQTDALDPINAMFWAWNTGYIFVKMEGKSPVSKQPGHLLEFHIGGYMQPNNCIRTINLNIKNELAISNKAATLNIKADIAELFKTPTSIDFSMLSSATDFHNATTIANNYADMFSIKE
jgi:hypothetical protein